jgi:gliding motility-associated-like protein
MRTVTIPFIIGLLFVSGASYSQQLIADFCFCNPDNILENTAGADGLLATDGTQSNGEGIFNNIFQESASIDIPASIFDGVESVTMEFDVRNQKRTAILLISAGGAEDAANDVPNGLPFRIGNKTFDTDNNGNVGLLVDYYTTADPTTPISSGFIPGSEIGLDERATVVFTYDKALGLAQLFKNNALVWETPAAQRTPGESFYLETQVTDEGQGYLTVGVNTNQGAPDTPSLYYFRAYDRACPTVSPPVVQPIAPLCREGTVTLRASADQADGNYRWYDARNGTPIAGAVNSTYTTAVTQSTTYYVSVREGPCESERVPLEVRVITAPPAPVVADQERCGPGVVTLTAESATADAYHWYASDGTTLLARTEFADDPVDVLTDQSQSSFVTDALTASTDFYVAALTEGCEGERVRVRARILFPPPPPAVSEQVVCEPDTVSLRVDRPTEGDFYRWYDQSAGGTLLQKDDSGVLRLLVTSDTAVYVSTWNGSCESERVRASATIYRESQLDAGPDTRVVPDGEVQLQASQGYDQYAWHPTDGLSNPYAADPVASPEKTTTYWLTAVTPAGCEETDRLTVEVVDYPIPNAFTPNDDGLNDRWEVPFLERYPNCEVAIYNRWGEIVYHSNGYQQPWEGRLPNQRAAVLGTYTYVIDLNNGKPLLRGSLVLLK